MYQSPTGFTFQHMHSRWMDGSSSKTHTHTNGDACIHVLNWGNIHVPCTIPIRQHPGREPTSQTSLKPKPSSPASAAAATTPQEIQEKQNKLEIHPCYLGQSRKQTLQQKFIDNKAQECNLQDIATLTIHTFSLIKHCKAIDPRLQTTVSSVFN
jgi:hypothetical protein